jgi:hypothetical protein
MADEDDGDEGPHPGMPAAVRPGLTSQPAKAKAEPAQGEQPARGRVKQALDRLLTPAANDPKPATSANGNGNGMHSFRIAELMQKIKADLSRLEDQIERLEGQSDEAVRAGGDALDNHLERLDAARRKRDALQASLGSHERHRIAAEEREHMSALEVAMPMWCATSCLQSGPRMPA